MLVFFSTGCESDRTARPAARKAGTPIKIVTTIFPLADWVKRVGGEHVEVSTLLPAGTSPHTFSEQPDDIKRIHDAQLFVKVGLNMDDWGGGMARGSGVQMLSLGDELQKAGKLPDPHDIEAGTSIEAEATSETEDEHHHHDHTVNPHFWLGPEQAKAGVLVIAEQLAAIAPEHADAFRKNTKAYIAEIDKTDAAIREQLAPCKGKSFVTFHDAFPYFAHHYGLKIAAVIEEYPGKQPSEGYVKQVTKKLREIGAKTVFSEPQLDDRVAKIIANEIEGTTDVLDPYGDQIYTGRNNYLDLLKYNAGKLKKHLCP